MSTKPPSTQTRRERRAVERAARRTPASAPGGGSALRSPVVLASLGALAIGVLVVLGLVLSSRPGAIDPVRTPMAGLVEGVPRDGRSMGAPDAPLTIEVYEDPQCPACGIWTREVEPLLMAKQIAAGEVRLVYRDFAFLGPESIDAAVAMRAAEQLGGRFWEMHALVFANQKGENAGALSRERLAEMAVLAGLDRAAFLALLDDPALIAAVEQETQEGVARGIASTPTLVIAGELAPGVPSWAELDGLLTRMLAAEASTAP